MSFLTFEPDLTGYAFTNQELTEAKEGWKQIITHLFPDWNEKTSNPFTFRWFNDCIPHTLFLINLWQTLRGVAGRISLSSRVRFEDKVRAIINAKNEKHFIDNWLEIQTASFLTNITVPIAIEPLVSDAEYASPNKPPSPDFGIKIGDEFILVEATAIRIESLDDYANSRELLIKFYQKNVSMELFRSIHVAIPFLTKVSDISLQQLRLSLKDIRTLDRGSKNLRMDQHLFSVSWMPMPRVSFSDSSFPEFEGMFAMDSSGEASYLGSIGVSVEMTVQDHDLYIDKIRRSVHNTLKGKKRQSHRDHPNIVFLCLSHSSGIPTQTVNLMIHLINSEMFNKPDYAWLSGVVIYHTLTDFSENSQMSGVFSVNPNARHLATEDLKGAFSGEKTFFWWKNEFGRPDE